MTEDHGRLRELADSLPQIVWSVSADGKLEYFNRRWYELTRATRPDEQIWRELVHPDDRPRFAEVWQRSLQTFVPLEVEYRLRFPGETDYRWYLGRALPVRDETGTVVRWWGTSTDIDAQKCTEALLTSKRHILEMIAGGAPLADTLDAIARLIDIHWPHGIASIMLVDDEGRLRVGAAPGLPKAYTAALEGVSIGPSVGSCGTAAFRREPVIVRDIATSELWADFRDAALAHDLHACWSVPIVTNTGRLVGTVAVYYKEPREPHPEETDFATDSGAALAAIAIERVLSERALDEHARALDAANRNKDQFIAKLAHELRNPLGAMQAAIQVWKAKAAPDSPLQRPHAVIERQTSHIIRLVDDLRDLSRVARGEIDVRRQRVDLRTIVAEAIDTVRPVAEARQQQVTLQMPDTEVPVNGDPARLTQVFVNILNNAAKYTQPGGQIAVAMATDGQSASIRVRDNGMGISPRMLEKIFDLYAQGDDIDEHAQGGMGIGLHLVQSLVALHGGTVTAQSAGVGQGSEFDVRLPLLH